MRQILINVVLGASIALSVSSASADDALSGAEIHELLIGNTATGAQPPGQGSGPWYAYYSSDGKADFLAPEVDPNPIRGRWRIVGNDWCVIWPRSGEACYVVARRGAEYVFEAHRQDLRDHRFHVLAGDAKQISSPSPASADPPNGPGDEAGTQVASAPKKMDLRGVTIGMTIDRVKDMVPGSCRPTAEPESPPDYTGSSLACDLTDGAYMYIVFSAPVTGLKVTSVSYHFDSVKTCDEIQSAVTEQFGVAPVIDWHKPVWHLSDTVELRLECARFGTNNKLTISDGKLAEQLYSIAREEWRKFVNQQPAPQF